MLWIKAFHIIFLVTWFAGLFYLPRLFVYHAMAEDAAGRERFKVMERKLYYGIMAPGAVLTIVFGVVAVAGLRIQPEDGCTQSSRWWRCSIAYHLWCGKLMEDFKHDRNTRGHVWYRWFNEVPNRPIDRGCHPRRRQAVLGGMVSRGTALAAFALVAALTAAPAHGRRRR